VIQVKKARSSDNLHVEFQTFDLVGSVSFAPPPPHS